MVKLGLKRGQENGKIEKRRENYILDFSMDIINVEKGENYRKTNRDLIP